MSKKNNHYKTLILLICLTIFLLTSCTSSVESVTKSSPSETSPVQKLTSPSSTTVPTPATNLNLLTSNNGKYGRIQADTLPIDEIVKWKTDLQMNIVSVAHGEGSWVVTLQEFPDIEQEVVVTSSQNLKNVIIEHITAGKYIAKIIWTDDFWVIFFSNILKANSQEVIFSPDISLEKISAAKSDGYFVTDISYGDKQWVVILSKTNEILDQKVEFIENLWSEKYTSSTNEYLLTTISLGNDKLVSVKSKYADYTSQEILLSDEFQKDYIQFAWFDGYKNFNVFYINGNWIHTIWK